jgi:hypothetical protein
MREEKVLKCLNRLKEYGFLDDSYQFTSRARKGAWWQQIALGLFRKGCKWGELEKHFGKSNMRDHRELESFENRMSKKEAEDRDVKIYNTIENCFA